MTTVKTVKMSENKTVMDSIRTLKTFNALDKVHTDTGNGSCNGEQYKTPNLYTGLNDKTKAAFTLIDSMNFMTRDQKEAEKKYVKLNIMGNSAAVNLQVKK